ncbi:FAD-binding domain-containing protein [Fretibacter rubidus]|uniref:FAD-binding domain-containing protein n=1 Tax=Fretibacter rubidus TaxID=570162 RepID=UPI003529DBF6
MRMNSMTSNVDIKDSVVPLAKRRDKDSIEHAVRALSPNAVGKASSIRGGRDAAMDKLSNIDPEGYGRTRNHTDGAVTQLSPYIRHGVFSLNAVRNEALDKSGKNGSEKFIQQLAWRDYWQRLYADNPDMIWNDVEDYKTGFDADDYADDLPDDIAAGQTGTACIDHFLRELLSSGTMHNHARLYVAGYICHWRRVKWQAGARFFLSHLLDGDPASNNLSWQWVASTFSQKPYFFNLENVQKFTGPSVDSRPETNQDLVGSYDDLRARLFPHMPYPS